LDLSQSELADLVGVSRQTIYYLERGSYNPSLTISFKLSEILKKPIEQIFHQEPIIKDILEDKSLAASKEVAEMAGITIDKLASLSDMNDEELTSRFTEDQLAKITKGLGMKFDDLFEKEAEN
jgi:putative transcriptional regulator